VDLVTPVAAIEVSGGAKPAHGYTRGVWISSLSWLLLSSGVLAPAGGLEPVVGHQHIPQGWFVDGGRRIDFLRVDDHSTLLTDHDSGRQAQVRATATVLVRAHEDIIIDWHALALVPVHAVDARTGWWLARSVHPREDGLDAAARLSLLSSLSSLSALSSSIDVYPNVQFRHQLHQAAVLPNDERYAGQWYFDEIALEQAWALHQGNPDTRIAIVDNGCDLNHPDLRDKFVGGAHLDVVDDDEDPSPGQSAGNEHGTACAGLAAATTDNGIDIAGACPNCTLSCIRLLPDDNQGVPLDADVRTFAHARDSNVAVVSNSWGFVDAFPVPSPLAESIRSAATGGNGGRGAVIVFAAGNDNRIVGDDELLAVEGVIGVGAVGNLGELTQYTNRGNSVDIVAPTGTITTDISGARGNNDGDVTSQFGGTSSACPIVSGIAGLVLSFDDTLEPSDVEALMIAHAEQSFLATPDDNGHDDGFGFGLIQPLAMLQSRQPPPPPPPLGNELPVSCGCAEASPTHFAWWSVACLWWFRRRAMRRA
jgi:serine protease